MKYTVIECNYSCIDFTYTQVSIQFSRLRGLSLVEGGVIVTDLILRSHRECASYYSLKIRRKSCECILVLLFHFARALAHLIVFFCFISVARSVDFVSLVYSCPYLFVVFFFPVSGLFFLLFSLLFSYCPVKVDTFYWIVVLAYCTSEVSKSERILVKISNCT